MTKYGGPPERRPPRLLRILLGIVLGAIGLVCLGAAAALDAPLAPIVFFGGLVLLFFSLVMFVSSSGQTISGGPIHYR